MEPEPIEVLARFDAKGRILPVEFVYKGSAYLVTGAGRRWQAQDGYHVLVMTPGEQVYHLLFIQSENRWYLLPRAGATFAAPI
jgi:hypothetical protein